MKNKFVILGITTLFILTLASIAIYNSAAVKTDSISFEANANVVSNNTSTLGVVTGSNLNLGSVPENSDVRKNIQISSEGFTMIKISSDGNISDMLSYNDTIAVDDRIEVEVTFNADKIGYYQGNLKTKILRPTEIPYSERWLRLRSKIEI